MLLFKDGRFVAKGVSYYLPEGFYLDPEGEGSGEYCLLAVTPDLKAKVFWSVVEASDAKKELESFFNPSSGLRPLSEIQPIEVNGLHGYQVFYKDSRRSYFEVRLVVGSGLLLEFMIQCMGFDIQEYVKGEYAQALLAGIQKAEDRFPGQ